MITEGGDDRRQGGGGDGGKAVEGQALHVGGLAQPPFDDRTGQLGGLETASFALDVEAVLEFLGEIYLSARFCHPLIFHWVARFLHDVL
ncbi:MAG TPA: hypothetical protein VHM90_07060 [Phycisphaerae bacterium]|nr:hypothetical protein [Phycisphaerae bacterium]